MNYNQGYGPPPPHGYGPPPKRGIGAGTVILIIFGCLFSGCVGLCALGAHNANKQAESRTNEPPGSTNTSTRATPAAATPAPATPKSYTKVTASKLIEDYDGNEIRGDNAWKNQDVEVTGVVRSIDKGPFGGLYVVLSDGNRMSFHSVHVNLKDSEQVRAASLNKGQPATFKGRVQGFVIGSVSVRDAEIGQL